MTLVNFKKKISSFLLSEAGLISKKSAIVIGALSFLTSSMYTKAYVWSPGIVNCGHDGNSHTYGAEIDLKTVTSLPNNTNPSLIPVVTPVVTTDHCNVSDHISDCCGCDDDHFSASDHLSSGETNFFHENNLNLIKETDNIIKATHAHNMKAWHVSEECHSSDHCSDDRSNDFRGPCSGHINEASKPYDAVR